MSKKNRNDQIPTPLSYVEEMLDRIGYQDHIVGKKVLENSCGQGNILCAIVKRYIAEAKRVGMENHKIAAGLQRDIMAFEIDEAERHICIHRLNDLCYAEGIPAVEWNILKTDFLKFDIDKIQADYVIGNPPYVTYHDIDEIERAVLHEKFVVCKKGRYDYCYAFIEASMRALAPDGKLIYLIPFSIFRNRYAGELRKYIWNNVTEIIDFTGKKVFDGITCSTAFLICEKGHHVDEIMVEHVLSGQRIVVPRTQLDSKGQKWIFQMKDGAGTNVFHDYFEVHNSVATLLNEAFLIMPVSETEKFLQIDSGKNIERKICLPAISTKSAKNKKDKAKQYIIFPYSRSNDIIERYEEKDFEKMFPCTYQHMLQYKERLLKRKADQSVKWYEYGRGQLLNELWKEKLVLPMVVTRRAKTYYADEETVPYAGYFITQKEGSCFTLEDARIILESAEFYEYVQIVGTPTTETSYRVSVEDIKQYRF